MEKHRRSRGGDQPPRSLDGFVRSGRQLGVPPRAYEPTRGQPTPTLDTFGRRTDGFYPAQQTARGLDRAESTEAQLLDEPIVLDHIEERQRKLRFWQRHARLKKGIKRAALTAVVIILAGAGYFGYKLYHTEKKVLAGGGKAATVCSDYVDTSLLHKEGDSRINILLLGTGGPGHDGPDLTDTMMLASIDPINNKAVLLSIPRDLWVNIPGYGSEKINHAYAYGKEYSKAKSLADQERNGFNLVDQTLQPILDGVPIDYHVVLDFEAFQQMVNALGGVTVNVPEEVYDPTIAWENNWNPVIAMPGVQTFNGHQALEYARSRETSSDFARADRQRLLISAIKQKAFSLGTFSNPIKVSSLLDSLGNNVYTDFSSGDLRCLYNQLKTVPASAIKSEDLVTPPNQLLTTGNLDGQSIVEPLAGLSDYDDIHTFLHGILPDGLITQENAPIAVYNATNIAGVATAETTLLKSYRYNIDLTANAPTATDPATTTIVDLSHGQDKYTLHYLETRFGVTAVTKLPGQFGITPPAGAKFVIILGSDASSASQD